MKYLKQIIFLMALELISMNGFATAVWNQKPNFPAVGRHRGTGISIGDKGYIGLGHVNGTGVNVPYADWWEFDPATNSWSQKADYPVANYGSAAFGTDTKGYVGGGVFLGPEFYEFDPITNVWQAIANAPINVNDRIAFAVNNLGYITAGTDLYGYDPVADSWSAKQNPPGTIFTWASACVLQNSAFVKSGSNLYEYKASTDAWIIKNSYPGLASNGGVAFSANNKCYFLLGYSGSLGNVTKEMYEYDPATDNWAVQPEFAGTSRRFACAFTINNRGYIGIGTNGINFSDFWEYNRILSNEVVDITEKLVKVYPCPAKNFVTFDLSHLMQNEPLKIKIYNTSGRIIKEIDCANQKLTINRDDLSSGLYLYSISGNNTVPKNGQFIFN